HNRMISVWKKKVLVILLVLVWIGGPASGILTVKADAASSILGGIPSKGNLKITISDGNVSVARHDGTSFENQYYPPSEGFASSYAVLSINDGENSYMLGIDPSWSNEPVISTTSQMISSDNRFVTTTWQ